MCRECVLCHKKTAVTAMRVVPKSQIEYVIAVRRYRIAENRIRIKYAGLTLNTVRRHGMETPIA